MVCGVWQCGGVKCGDVEVWRSGYMEVSIYGDIRNFKIVCLFVHMQFGTCWKKKSWLPTYLFQGFLLFIPRAKGTRNEDDILNNFFFVYLQRSATNLDFHVVYLRSSTYTTTILLKNYRDKREKRCYCGTHKQCKTLFKDHMVRFKIISLYIYIYILKY